MKKTLCALLASFVCFAGFMSFAAELPKVGTVAPVFTLPGQDGKDVALKDFAGKWVVLYFYPKDFTSGCSLEAHNFQTDINKYHAKKAVIVGVSVDSVESHQEFCTKQGLDFKLLSDSEEKVSEQYGSLTHLVVTALSARNTFLIDPKGIIRKVYSPVNPTIHSKQVLADLDILQRE